MANDQLVADIRAVEEEVFAAVGKGKSPTSPMAKVIYPMAERLASSAQIWGYISGKGLENDAKDIIDGYNRSSVCLGSFDHTPEFDSSEDYCNYGEVEYKDMFDKCRNYIDRWLMYRDMFDHISLAQGLSKGKNNSIADLPQGHHEFAHTTYGQNAVTTADVVRRHNGYFNIKVNTRVETSV